MTPWIIGNWKLNPASVAEAKTLVTELATLLENQPISDANVMVAPSFVHLPLIAQQLQQLHATSDMTPIKLASQDVTALCDDTGAYTGDVSAVQLQDIGIQWSLIGHSERRQYYQEDNKVLSDKLQCCAAKGIGTVFCIGESEAQFDAGQTELVLAEQLEVINTFIDTQINKLASQVAQPSTESNLSTLPINLIVAYEPVWAIGTGKTPTVEQVTQVHEFIRHQLTSFHKALADTPLLYGGSVKPDNAADFAASSVINGVLVGGASLQADSFYKIAQQLAS